jgi:hypothetical protein
VNAELTEKEILKEELSLTGRYSCMLGKSLTQYIALQRAPGAE